jgi:hypothetical protein
MVGMAQRSQNGAITYTIFMNAPNSSEVSNATVGWFPVFTLLLGFAIKFISDAIEHKRALERDRETRRELRRDQLAQRSADFQRQTLLELQDALMDIGRSAGEMHHADRMAYVKSGAWQKQRYPEVLSEKNRTAYARTSMLTGRVRDAVVRDLVKEFKDHATNVTACDAPHLSDRAWEEMVSTGQQLHDRIGELLRTLNDEERP